MWYNLHFSVKTDTVKIIRKCSLKMNTLKVIMCESKRTGQQIVEKYKKNLKGQQIVEKYKKNLKWNKWHHLLHTSLFVSLFVSFFLGHAYGMQKFLGQGSNPWHSRGPSHSSHNAGSLTHCATREFHTFHF